MERSRLLECLAADFTRLRSVAASDLSAAVPSCPGWSAADLVAHVGEVYLHKTACMRLDAEPDPWPPAELKDEDPLALLDRAYAELTTEFTARDPAGPAHTWFGPDQTVGFLIRRMAQETVIHRLDAELALGVEAAPVPDDLAVDGTDELLKTFVSYGTVTWPQMFTETLCAATGRTVNVQVTGADGWHVRTDTAGLHVTDGPTPDADATVAGSPAGVLRWLWAREAPGVSEVQLLGDEAALAEFRVLLNGSTQ